MSPQDKLEEIAAIEAFADDLEALFRGEHTEQARRGALRLAKYLLHPLHVVINNRPPATRGELIEALKSIVDKDPPEPDGAP